MAAVRSPSSKSDSSTVSEVHRTAAPAVMGRASIVRLCQFHGCLLTVNGMVRRVLLSTSRWTALRWKIPRLLGMQASPPVALEICLHRTADMLACFPAGSNYACAGSQEHPQVLCMVCMQWPVMLMVAVAKSAAICCSIQLHSSHSATGA